MGIPIAPQTWKPNARDGIATGVLRTNDVSGYRHILALADRFGLDTSAQHHAAAVSEFGALPVDKFRQTTLRPQRNRWQTQAIRHGSTNFCPTKASRCRTWRTRYTRCAERPSGKACWRAISSPRRPPCTTAAVASRPVRRAAGGRFRFARATEWLQNQRLNVPLDTARHAVETVAEERQVHPVREYLGAQEHDGPPRADTLLIDYFGAADAPLNRAIGAKSLSAPLPAYSNPAANWTPCRFSKGVRGCLNPPRWP